MQELVLILTGIAGAASAVAYKRFPRHGRPVLGASHSIKNKIHTLRIEKDILTKTISRLYQRDAGISQVQKDRLLSRYQHQLGIVLARIEKLQEAERHPDLGPVGDGLLTLMDQKLSTLDQRLYELSSKIAIANAGRPVMAEPKKQIKRPELKSEKPPIQEKQELLPASKGAMEITTLTRIYGGPARPAARVPASPVIVPAAAPVTVPAESPVQPSPQVPESSPQAEHSAPEQSPDDEADLARIKEEIIKTLAKIEQAEVE